MRGPATARSGAMPDSSRAAGLHNVDARVRHHCQGRHVQLPGKGAMFDTEDVGVFLGLDVGKQTHHGHGLTPAGKKVLDKQLPNSEPKLRAVFDKLTAKFGTVLVVVDQPASIGALPLTVARDASCKVAYLPGLAMRRIAEENRCAPRWSRRCGGRSPAGPSPPPTRRPWSPTGAGDSRCAPPADGPGRPVGHR